MAHRTRPAVGHRPQVHELAPWPRRRRGDRPGDAPGRRRLPARRWHGWNGTWRPALLSAANPPRTLPAENPRLLKNPAGCDCPSPTIAMLGRVRHYLTQRRGLAASLIEPLVQSGKLYADSRGNAVFLLVAGKAQRPVGAELRGTGPRVWRGMAPGTRKDLGYFWIGAQGSREIVLCESAIDAMSCFQIDPQRICISTSGVRADPPWLDGLLARGYDSTAASTPTAPATPRPPACWPSIPPSAACGRPPTTGTTC